MRQKRKFWQRLAIFISAIIATLLGYGQPKARATEAKALPNPDIFNRLSEVRKQMELNRQDLNDQTPTADSPNQPTDNSAKESEQDLAQYWNNWGNYWGNGWRNWGNY